MLPEDLSRVREFMDYQYRDDNPAYDFTSPFNFEIHIRTYKTIESLVQDEILSKTMAFDVSCGTGELIERLPHRNVVGIDISQEAIRRARRAFPGVRFIVSAAEEWIPDRKFKLVFAVECVEHWVDPVRALAMIRAASEPGAALAITSSNRDSLHCRIGRKLGIEPLPINRTEHLHEFGYQEFISMVERSGFKHVTAKGMYLAPYWALEDTLGHRIRQLTDWDTDVNEWMQALGETAPPELCMITCHRFEAV